MTAADRLTRIRALVADPSYGSVPRAEVVWLCDRLDAAWAEEVRLAEHVSRQRMALSAAEDALADLRAAIPAQAPEIAAEPGQGRPNNPSGQGNDTHGISGAQIGAQARALLAGSGEQPGDGLGALLDHYDEAIRATLCDAVSPTGLRCIRLPGHTAYAPEHFGPGDDDVWTDPAPVVPDSPQQPGETFRVEVRGRGYGKTLAMAERVADAVERRGLPAEVLPVPAPVVPGFQVEGSTPDGLGGRTFTTHAPVVPDSPDVRERVRQAVREELDDVPLTGEAVARVADAALADFLRDMGDWIESQPNLRTVVRSGEQEGL